MIPSVVRVVRRNRTALMVSTALQASAMAVHAQPAPNARPTSGIVVGGSAAISQSATNTQITQSSTRTAINWQSFNVGSQQSVTFNQPNSTAVALNRVTGPDPSQIAGRIDANGQVILINQSGVNFYKGAQVNTAGLIVSTADTTNKNFMAGGVLKFDQPGNPNAKIDNQGNITIRQAGLAALVAPQVANSGTISARLGHVVLAGAKTSTVDLYGDGLLSLDVTNQVTQVPIDKSGNTVSALVTNKGVIIADGGTVQLTAAAADGIVQNLVQAGGKIQAATVGNQTGTIALNGVGGAVVVEGQLAAPGSAPGTQGGNIEVVSTGNVGIASTALINASGKTSGGTVAIGTTLARARGGPSVTATATARNVTIQQGATIAANAVTKGNGGKVAVLSTDTTRMAGTINAKGGKNGGDGGFVEVSGAHVSQTGPVDLSAPSGATGTLLLDPDNLTIVHSTSASGSLDPTLNTNKQIVYGDNPGGTDTITDFEFNSLNANILLQAAKTLTLNPGAPLTLGAGKSLTLQTQTGDITIGSSITASGAGGIIMQAGTNAGSGGKLVINADLITDASTGSIALQADGGITFGTAKLTAGTIDLSNITTGGVTEAASGLLNAGTLQSAKNVAGSVTLSNANTVATIGTFTVSGAGNSFSLTNAPTQALTIAGLLSAPQNVTLAAATLAINGSVAGTVVDLSVAGNVTQPGTAVVNAATLQSTGGVTGNVALSGTANAVSNIGNFVANSGFALANTATLTVKGTLSSAGDIYLQTTAPGGIAIAGTGKVAAGAASRASFQAAKMAINAGGTVTGGTFEFALNSPGGALTLGPGAPLVSLAGVGTTNAEIGGVTVPNVGFTTTAASIDTVGTFDGNKLPLALQTTGTIGEGPLAPIINVTALSGSATSATLNAANAIASVGSFAATGGGFLLDDSGLVGALTVPGRLTANGNVTIAGANTLTVTGSIGTSGIVDLSSGGTVSESPSGIISAGTLRSSGSVTGDFDLSLGVNDIANLGSILAGGVFSLNDKGHAGALAVAGPISGSNVTLAAGSGGLDLTGNVSGSVVDLSAIGGGITQAGTAIINGAILQSSGSATGNVDLFGTANAVTSLGDFAVSGGTDRFALKDSVNLLVTGTVTAPGQVYLGQAPGFAIDIAAGGSIGAGSLASFQADTFTNLGAVTGGTFELAPASKGIPLTLTPLGNIPNNDRIGAVTLPGTASATITAGAISIGAPFGNSTTTLELDSLGGITEPFGGITAARLTGQAGADVRLDNANTIASLGSFSVAPSGSFTLKDLGETGTLMINGPVSATGVSVSDAGAITVKGGVAASSGTALLATTGSGGILLDTGAVVSGSAVHLDAAGGGVTETTGVIDAKTLLSSGGVTGAVALGALNNVATLASFTVTGGNFALSDGASPTGLAVTGPVTAGNVAINSVINQLTVTGSIGATGTVSLDASSGSSAIALNSGAVVTGTTLDLKAGSGGIRMNGNALLDGPVVDLTAAGNGVDEVGTATIIAGTLQSAGNIAGFGTLAGAANAIASIGSLAVTGGPFSLIDTGTLNVTGKLSASSVTISDSGALTVSGTASSTGPVSLTADSIAIPGTVGGVDVALFGTLGAIVETGVLDAVTLTGSAVGTASLTGTSFSNTIGTLNGFSAAGLTLDDSGGLTVLGTVSGGPSVTIADKGALAIKGTVTATAVSLTADSITIPGEISGSTVSLFGTVGAIAETGVLNVGTLTGSAATTAALTGTSFSNSIGTLNGFTAAGFTLDDAIGLTILGTVSGGPNATIADKGLLAINGSVTASTISLTADSISEPGALIGSTLTGSSTGSASLTGTAFSNSIGTLNGFTAAGLNLDDAIGLTVLGTVSGGPSVAIASKGPLAIDGTVAANAVSLTADSISEPGAVNAGTLTGSTTGGTSLTGTAFSNHIGTLDGFSATGFTLDDAAGLTVLGTVSGGPSVTIADQGPLAINGTVTANTISLTASTISEPGALIGGTLTGSSTGNASLTGTSFSNSIGTLNGFSATGFTLDDAAGLTLLGTVSGGPSVTIADKGPLAINGTVTANAISLTADSISEPGALIGSTLTGSTAGSASLTGTSFSNSIGTLNGFNATGFTLNDAVGLTVLGTVAGGPSVTIADKGPLAVNGTVTASTISLTADSINEPGALTADTLTGSTTGSANLTGTSFSNSIGTLNGFTASGFTLDDGVGLTVVGTLSGGPSATIVDKGALAINGAVSASAASLTAASIAIPGAVTATTVGLFGTIGAIGETGVINAGTLTGSAATTADLTGTGFSNQVGTVSGFTASGFTLIDGADLTISGNVTGGPSVGLLDSRTITVGTGAIVSGDTVSATATGDIAIAGAIEAPKTITLVSDGNIAESGTLIADLLTGNVTGDATLTGSSSNGIYQLGSFTTGGTFTLNDTVGLTIVGPLTAPTIVIDTGNSAITLADQAVITTAGPKRPAGTLANYPGDTPATTSNGAFITTAGGFIQLGTSYVLGINSGPSVLRINAKGSANITFDAGPTAGLQGPSTWLILDINAGKASGHINVHDLDVIQNGQGTADLNGTVTGLSGSAAAGASGIQPIPNSRYQINSCPIHSVSCVLLPSEGVPVANPLNEIYFGSAFNPNEDEDLLLPIVSDQDY